MKLIVQNPKQPLNKAYLKEKVGRDNIELFKRNLSTLLGKINENESEEHLKNLISDFLKDTWYKEINEINTKDRKDLVIHVGKTTKEPVGIIIEVKKPSNKMEMIASSKPNCKALHELILYYLRERIEYNNIDIKYLIVTNIYEWFIFDEVWFEKNIYRNSKLKKDYESWKLSGNDTKFFYENIAKPFVDTITEAAECTYFDIRQFEAVIKNQDTKDDNKLIALYKVLSPVHLLKLPFANDSNSLDTKFYSELLHLLGLEEVKEGSKKLIKRKEKPEPASLLESTIIKLEDKDCLRNIQGVSTYGLEKNEQLFNVALELCITWINRILFLKLLEAQLFKYHKGNEAYVFLNHKIIHDFDELSNLFFQVLAEKPKSRREHLKDKFKHVPYLNSSLFERTDLERQTFDISGLDNRLELSLISSTVLKNETGKRKSGRLETLQYLFDFLDAYDFTSEGSEEIQEQNKNLINASVLGLIFEKINGYKDGSFFTPGFVTMYMCRETIRRSVVQKFNDQYKIDCETFDDVKNYVASKFKAKDILEFNKVINDLKICDPAVGSGHFLVSVLNEIIAIKAELGILADKEGLRLTGYEVKIENDELIVTYNDNTEIFEYSVTSGSIAKETQRVQKTLFHEKESIIENSLFGVDINPNSVKICRLRLWIELLKNAYYTDESKFSELETLPNIDINIKCGNSLISRFPLDADLKKALKGKWNIDTYKIAVHSYREAESKEEKRKLEELIDTIKKDFRSEIGMNDPRRKRLSKLKEELYLLTVSPKLELDVEIKKGNVKIEKEKVKKLTEDINKIEQALMDIENSKVYENAFEWRFEFPEALDKDGDFIGFDVMVGNPPYGSIFNDLEKKFIKQAYKSYLYKFDSYVYFIERGFDLLKEKGYLCYITPELWLSLENCKPIRKIITQDNGLLFINVYGENVFKDAVVNTCSFLGQKNEVHNKFSIIYNEQLQVVEASEYVNKDDFRIEYRLNPIERKIIRKIQSNSITLSTLGDVIQGITPYDKYSGQDEKTIKTRAYHSDKRIDKTSGKWLDGKHVNRYEVSWGGEWIRYGDWLAAPREKRFFVGERLMFREVPGKGKRIQAAYSDEEYYYGHAISPFKLFPKSEYSLKYILGAVNSKLISWYGQRILPNFGKDVFPKLNPNDIKMLPIPQNKGADKISKLVDEILILKNNDAETNTLKQEDKIDQIIYELYNLSKEEINLIERN